MKWLFFLSFISFTGSIFFNNTYSQIKKAYEFDLKGDIIWLTNKEFKIFVSTKKGVFTLNNIQVINTKDQPPIKLSPLGRELISLGSNKISSFKVGDELVLNNEIDFNYKQEVKKIISDKYTKRGKYRKRAKRPTKNTFDNKHQFKTTFPLKSSGKLENK